MEVEHIEVLEIVNRVLGKDSKNKSFLETIEDLLAVIEKQQHEYITLSQSIAEDDTIISSLKEELQLANNRITELERKQVKKD